MLTAQITGGLGNPLFTYARLASYAYLHNIDLNIDGSVTERVFGRKPYLFDFKLRGESQITAAAYNRCSTQIERALWRNTFTRRVTKRHQETLLGNAPLGEGDFDGWKVRGFFQDFKVADDFIDTFGKKPFALKTESTSLMEMSKPLGKESTIGIHVRRGDYLNYKESFGVLADEYYLNAFNSLMKKDSYTNILIFTDSPELVLGIKNKLDLKSRVILPAELSTSETLILMSRCSCLITSNSTFSFWAGMIGDDMEVVIPTPWFRSSDPWLRSSNFNKMEWAKQNAVWT